MYEQNTGYSLENDCKYWRKVLLPLVSATLSTTHILLILVLLSLIYNSFQYTCTLKMTEKSKFCQSVAKTNAGTHF